MGQARYAKTANRSVVGIMNEFAYLGDLYRDDPRVPDLETLALQISRTPCGPFASTTAAPTANSTPSSTAQPPADRNVSCIEMPARRTTSAPVRRLQS